MEKMTLLIVISAITCLISYCSPGHSGQTGGKADNVALMKSEAQQNGAYFTDIADKDSNTVKKFLRNLALAFGRRGEDSLMDRSMTPHALEIYGRMVMAHDCDMIVLAQDTPDDFEKTLVIKRQKPGWYSLEYYDPWSGKTIGNRFYVVKNKNDGQPRIAYVQGYDSVDVSEADNNDSFFLSAKPKIRVGGDTPKEFLSSFYKAYTAVYISLNTQVAPETKVLRDKFLSGEAMQQYQKAADKYIQDGMYGYDALIGGFYTTVYREKAREIKEVKKGVFSVGNNTELTVERVSGKWLITKINVSD